MLSHSYNIAIDNGVVAPGHLKYVGDGFNATEKRFLTMFMTTVQLLGAATIDSHMAMHTSMNNTDISIAREFKKSFVPNTCTCIDLYSPQKNKNVLK